LLPETKEVDRRNRMCQANVDKNDLLMNLP